MLMIYAGESGTTILTMNEQNLEWTNKVSGTERIKLLALSEQSPRHWTYEAPCTERTKSMALGGPKVHIYFYIFYSLSGKITAKKSHKELKTLYINQ
jgi:hypothetical protein